MPTTTPPAPAAPDGFEAQRISIKASLPTDVCPFFGVGVSLVARQLSRAEMIQAGGQTAAPDLAPVFIPCLQEKCAMWTTAVVTSPGECVVRRGFTALASRMPTLPIPKMSVTPRD